MSYFRVDVVQLSQWFTEHVLDDKELLLTWACVGVQEVVERSCCRCECVLSHFGCETGHVAGERWGEEPQSQQEFDPMG